MIRPKSIEYNNVKLLSIKCNISIENIRNYKTALISLL